MSTPDADEAVTGPVPPLGWRKALVAGVLAGTASGLFGVGGGVVVVPALVLLAGFPHKLATGTSLTAIIPISIAATVGYAVDGEVDWAVAGLVAVGGLVGAYFGTRHLRTMRAPLLQALFGAFMIVTAVRLVVGADGDGAGLVDITLLSGAGLVLLGVGSGLLAGLFGVGGGIVIVPALTILFGAPLVLAKGTSLAVIVPTSVLGTWRNHKAGLTSLSAGLLVGATGIVAAVVAARVSLGLDPELSAALFAGLLLVMAVRMIRESRSPVAGG